MIDRELASMREDDRLTGDVTIDELDIEETQHKIVFTIRYETGVCRVIRLDKVTQGARGGKWEEL